MIEVYFIDDDDGYAHRLAEAEEAYIGLLMDAGEPEHIARAKAEAMIDVIEQALEENEKINEGIRNN